RDPECLGSGLRSCTGWLAISGEHTQLELTAAMQEAVNSVLGGRVLRRFAAARINQHVGVDGDHRQLPEARAPRDAEVRSSPAGPLTTSPPHSIRSTIRPSLRNAAAQARS